MKNPKENNNINNNKNNKKMEYRNKKEKPTN